MVLQPASAFDLPQGNFASGQAVGWCYWLILIAVRTQGGWHRKR